MSDTRGGSAITAVAGRCARRGSFSDGRAMVVRAPVIIGRDFAGEMQATFANDLAVSAAIDLERWERRPLSFRFKEWMARVWGRLL